MQEKFVTLDPSLFTSIGRLKDSHKILQALKQHFHPAAMKVVLPSHIFNEFDGILKGRKPEMLGKILETWLPFYPKDHIEALVKHFATDSKYREALKRLFDDYSPVSAQEYVGDVEKLGRESIHRERIKEELGDIVGKIIFETLAVSQKLKALVIAFGKRTFDLSSRMEVRVKEGVSEFKRMIKRHTNVRRALRIAGYVLSFDIARELMRLLGLPDLPFPKDVGLGLILVADG